MKKLIYKKKIATRSIRNKKKDGKDLSKWVKDGDILFRPGLNGRFPILEENKLVIKSEIRMMLGIKTKFSASGEETQLNSEPPKLRNGEC